MNLFQLCELCKYSNKQRNGSKQLFIPVSSRKLCYVVVSVLLMCCLEALCVYVESAFKVELKMFMNCYYQMFLIAGRRMAVSFCFMRKMR